MGVAPFVKPGGKVTVLLQSKNRGVREMSYPVSAMMKIGHVEYKAAMTSAP
jgi:hypothetical protein